MSNTVDHSGEAKSYQSSQSFRRLVGLWLVRRFQQASLTRIMTAVGLAVVLILLLGLIQFSSPNLAGNDGYYHIKLAYIMRTEGLKPDFPWLPLTILNPREFYDHHFLYHVVLIPFTFGDLRIGAKLSAVLFATLAFLCVWRLLDKQRVPNASLWTLGLMAVSEAFIFRMSIPRAQSLSLAVLVIGIHWLLTKKHTRLFLLGFIYVWLYNAFPLLVAVTGIYVVAVWLSERQLDFHPLLYSIAGIIVGLVINPYFPYNITFAFNHITPKIFDTTAVSVGTEWFPYNTGQLLSNSPLALVAFISGTLALGLAVQRMDVRTAVTFLLACMFGFMLFQSRRFIEYFPAFSLMFAAFAWTPLINRSIIRNQIHALRNQEQSHTKLKRLVPVSLLVIVLIPGIWLTFNQSKGTLQTSTPFQLYANASAWLQANTPAGERVFQTDWDDFPRLFFHNSHNTYLVGLDPTYMQFYDAELYDHWVEITQGKVDTPSNAISAKFGAFYVFTDLHHQGFIDQAENDPQLVEVYRDTEAVIYQIVSN
ncbi:MAG: hypothetical protein ACNA8H_05045 [Anaerolineales bacterium]